MKYFLATLLLTMSFQATAQNTKMFAGKYVTSVHTCPMARAQKPQFALLKFATQSDGTRVLDMHIYGEEVVHRPLKLSNGQRPLIPSRKIPSYGISELWSSKFIDVDTFRIITRTLRSDGSESIVYEYLRMKGDFLNYSAFIKVKGQTGFHKDVCTLKKIPTDMK